MTIAAAKEKLHDYIDHADKAKVLEILALVEGGVGKSGFECLEENKLTKMAMSISEKSLQEDWENEDNAHWERFLKD